MRLYIAKFIRLISKLHFAVMSFLRIVYLELKYPGISIDFKTKIEKNCKIVCIDGGRLRIRNSFISAGTQLLADRQGSVVIEETFIGRNSIVVALKSIHIKKGCAIAEMVVIRDQNHKIDFSNLEETLYDYDVEGIEVGENVWIGAKATVLKGVVIGNKSIIGASAVVVSPVPSLEVWAGVPARHIRKL
jgi:acetyltransferase-like isoleucine patch superfamily enzyme